MIIYDALHARRRPSASEWHILEWSVIVAAVCGVCLLFFVESHYAVLSTYSKLYPRYEGFRTSILLGILPAILLCCCAFNGILYKLMSVYELRWLGNISYSFYLIHTLGINACGLVVLRSAFAKSHPYLTLGLSFPLALATSLLAASALFVAVEKRLSLRKRSAPHSLEASAPQCHIEKLAMPRFTVVKDALKTAAEVELSIVIPNFNTAEYVTAAVSSALCQTFTRLEVIVVDDGSTDTSLLKLEDINDLRVTVVTQPNRGLASARNTGIQIARGKYIGLLDSDDVWYPLKAEKQLAVMETNPAIGVTFCYSAYLDEAGEPTGQLLVSRCKQPTARELVFRNHIGNGSTPIIRRECFEEAGMFNESLKALEDQEMWVRIATRTHWKLQLVPQVLTGYRVRSSSLTNSSYACYVEQARLGIDAISGLPAVSQRDADRCYAEFLRIISRKALANGDVAISRSLIIDALRYCPWLALCDARAMALLAIHLLTLPLPPRFQMTVYRFARSVTRRLYSLFDASATSLRHGWE
jgi:hypothetical protein